MKLNVRATDHCDLKIIQNKGLDSIDVSPTNLVNAVLQHMERNYLYTLIQAYDLIKDIKNSHPDPVFSYSSTGRECKRQSESRGSLQLR